VGRFDLASALTTGLGFCGHPPNSTTFAISSPDEFLVISFVKNFFTSYSVLVHSLSLVVILVFVN